MFNLCVFKHKGKKKKAKAISTKGYICMIWHKILRAKIIRNV